PEPPRHLVAAKRKGDAHRRDGLEAQPIGAALPDHRADELPVVASDAAARQAPTLGPAIGQAELRAALDADRSVGRPGLAQTRRAFRPTLPGSQARREPA